jgi:hypothetical protein
MHTKWGYRLGKIFASYTHSQNLVQHVYNSPNHQKCIIHQHNIIQFIENDSDSLSDILLKIVPVHSVNYSPKNILIL